MWLLEAALVFLSQALWHRTGFRPAGRRLIHALGSRSENVRTIAGMFLVRAGRRAEPLLEEALRRREHLPMVLAILGDVGNRKFEEALRQFTGDEDPAIAQAARNALRVLAAHR